MMITYPPASIYCELQEDRILSIIIEEQSAFCNIVSDIQSQLDGEMGDAVLSENYNLIDIKKNADLITQLIPFTVNHKELINKLYSDLKLKSVDEKTHLSTNKMISDISRYIYMLIEDSEYELLMTRPDDISGFLKAFNIRFDDKELSLSEKLLEYMIASREMRGINVFITVNLRSYLTDLQAQQLFESVILRKLSLICIESSEHSHLPNEKIIIVDKDLCVI